jgi:hypothetical protein
MVHQAACIRAAVRDLDFTAVQPCDLALQASVTESIMQVK